METSAGAADLRPVKADSAAAGLHLLLIDPAFHDASQPGPTRGYDLMARFISAGHRATVLTCAGAAGVLDGLEVRTLRGVPRVGWDIDPDSLPRFARWAMREMWRVKEVDAVILVAEPTSLLVPAAIYGWARAIPIIADVRRLPPADAPPTAPARTRAWSSVKRFGRRLARLLPHRTMVASPAIAAALAAEGLSEARRLQLPAGSDLKLLTLPAGADNGVLRHTPELAGQKVAVWAGAFTSDRDLLRLVALAYALQGAAPDVTLVLCGNGPMRAEVIYKIHERGLPETTIRVLDSLPRARLAELLAVATVVLALPSANDLASDMFDGLAAGKPVVYLGEGWPQALLESRGAGFAINLTEPANAARELADVLRDTDGLRRAGQQAAALAASRFNLDRLAAEMRVAIEDLVAVAPRLETLRKRTLFGKRAVDILVSAAALIVLSPVMVVLAVLIGVKLGWPIVVSHDRAGLRGRPFRLFKFRTLTDAEDPTGALLPERQRLTSFGRALRRGALDEIPTLVNVLLGDMSLVGPRPYPVSYTAYYTPSQRRRLDLRPGLTGLAQVDRSPDRDWDAKFARDADYVDRVSLGLDATILAKTLLVLLRGRDIDGRSELPRFDEMMAHREGGEDA